MLNFAAIDFETANYNRSSDAGCLKAVHELYEILIPIMSFTVPTGLPKERSPI
jgi:hypothetical protein